MFTDIPLKAIVSSFSLILSGMITGNMMLIYLGLIPAIHMVISIYLRQPTGYWVEVEEGEIDKVVGGEVTLTRRVTVDEGIGPVIVGEKLPDEFELLDGNNIKAFWKGMKKLRKEYDFRIKCTKRGLYRLELFHIETRHPHRMTSTILDTLPLNQRLVVKPRKLEVKKIRHKKLYSNIPMPTEARIKMGVPTTDFKEIREYNFGDPYKHINWKATARIITTRRSPPAVNEYEKEGRRAVWLFLNSESKMMMGSSINNVFEHAIQAVQGLADFYLNRECMVGFAVFNNSSKYKDKLMGGKTKRCKKEEPNNESWEKQGKHRTVIFPDTGRIQGYKIQKALLKLEAPKKASNLEQTITQCRGYIKGTNPLFIIITRVTELDSHHLQEGIKELQKYIKKTRRLEDNIIVVNISGYKLAAQEETQEIASKLLEYKERKEYSSLGSTGIQVLHWRPEQHSLLQVFLNQVVRR